MDGDDSRLRAAHDRLLAQQQRAIEKYEQTIGKSKAAQVVAQRDLDTRRQAAAAEKQHQVQVARAASIVAANRSEQDKYNDSIRELDQLAQKSLLTEKQVIASKQRLKSEFKATKQASDGNASSIKNLAVQYISMQAAVSLLTKSHEEFEQVQSQALETTKAVAAAQQQSLKNLAGLNLMQQTELMTASVDDIVEKTGFAGRAQLTTALGAGISAGGSIEEVVSAVTASARINKQTPEDVGATASNAIDLAAASGIASAERNLGFLLNVQKLTRVEDQNKLANALAKTVGSVAATTTSDKEIGTREAAALFSTLNQQAKDKQGDSSATASISMAAYLRKFFEENGNDPGSLRGRLMAVQQDDDLRTAFLAKMPGEAAFKLPMEKLVTAGSDAFNMFEANLPQIQYDADRFDALASMVTGGTSELGIADTLTTFQSTVDKFDAQSGMDNRAAMKEILDEALPRLNPGGASGLIQNAFAPARVFNEILAREPDEFADYAIRTLDARRDAITDGSRADQDAERFIDKTIQSIERIVDRLQSDRAATTAAARSTAALATRGGE